MPRKPVIGVMGGGAKNEAARKAAFELGALVAENGWVLLNGGRNAGVMAASAEGAASRGGLVIGILPDDRDAENVAPGVSVAVFTGMGAARNNVNVLSSDVVAALPGGAGTISEIALAVKNQKPVVLLQSDPDGAVRALFPGADVRAADTPAQAMEQIRAILSQMRGK